MAIKFKFFENLSSTRLEMDLENYIKNNKIERNAIVKIYNHSAVWDGKVLNKVMLVYETSE